MLEFGSVNRLKQSSERDLVDLIGKSKAETILDAIKKGEL